MKPNVMETLKRQWEELTTNRRTRAILIGGLVLLLFGLGYRLYPVYQGLAGGQTDVAALQKRIAKYRQAVDGKASLEAGLSALEKSLEQVESGLLTGKTEALAAVDVQNILNEIAVASGVEIKRMQVLKSDTQNPDEMPYISVPVQFSVTVTIRQLQDILYKIETCPQKYLTLQWIRINTAGSRDDGEIRCDLAVAGIMKNSSE